ncbi:MAG: fibronectin type III domain-containing protein [Candidatus Azambacteria bacterium]|nr:fibronectin type III domain-containing protein [Candidatus Azambacteria bacterium]
MKVILACCVALCVLYGECLAGSITVGWEPPGSYTNLEPILNQDGIGYRIHFGVASGVYSRIIDVGAAMKELDKVCIFYFDGCVARSWKISGLLPGETYYFVVTAYSMESGCESAYSTEVPMIITADEVIPNDVTYFTATPFGSGIRLSWTNPMDSDLSQVMIECRNETNVGFVQLATLHVVPGMPQTYDHLGLAPGTYSYAIHTRDTSGNMTHTAFAEAMAKDATQTPTTTSSGGGGGCFIATAAYGSYLDPHVMVLRQFRDNYLLTNEPGKLLVAAYYATSPPLADFIARHEWARKGAQVALAPLVFAVIAPGSALIFFLIVGITPIGIYFLLKRWE